MRRFLPILTVLLTLALFTAVAQACPLCKDSVPNSDAQAAGGLPSGFNNSIYVMLGALFCVMGFLGYTIVRGIRGTGNGATAASTRRGGFNVIPPAAAERARA
jgi:hypothetical protein